MGLPVVLQGDGRVIVGSDCVGLVLAGFDLVHVVFVRRKYSDSESEVLAGSIHTCV